MRRTLSLAAVIAAALVLAGCSMLPFGNDDPTSGGSDGSGGSGGTGQPGDGSQDDGSADDDAVVSGSGQLPASWPAEVHVPEDGEVVTAVESPGSWVAQVAVSDGVAAFTEVSAQLKAAGFTALAETTTASGSIGVYENGQYQVQVLSNQDSGGWALTYSIVAKG
jgi:hypothetical protein